ncbi:preprotein translocase subunit SecY [Candidatus Giovannonibacteria bacterium RIFCSPLOWO2_02_FULL_43_11b]|uniref:Protein translocase subunit SecY n=1 Tax=Candidatus Giovannonibacteria bacterium RIFCSPHIGHO2_12_FULL_43_15 TaxID=1798341 RepID=A0A1F5WR39_9BACT|nr:MAG: preprotein translocase subunit SecY [Candidatus Giovannonibacteria bacterium RIFCSPHIGHO2_02_FULL_43_32]OGF78135.1 MAG: preprotein translocase subunit SecY [Candidatus Giovannonibacteria bacterium RIFCSPHIGHO2_12_FULL_43_15]OGF78542.1 MAG: preprotein translocase subunit SecY [Candidatus Giovannonibacteria bacterium RIFCSPLOWO2_01_FULL_43_60]OGF89877.1 MAG: preprotein translocase subunit SecY [Candidatus Giovannonibacteria bacterium RIFCSPLOWO2_02_FULL_43_11b]OGF92668.1 MAG: preprotein t
MEKIFLIFKDRELRNKILFVLGVLLVFRIVASMPIPGVDPGRLKQLFDNNQFLGLLNLFSGGALNNLSIVMLGVGPYITASIIMQLLTMIFPPLKEMYQEAGEAGRKKFNQYSRLLTVPLALIQGFSLLVVLRNSGIIGQLDLLGRLENLVVIVAGSIFMMWLGELISEYGIGNGISILIFAGIVSGIPSGIQQYFLSYDPSQIPIIAAFLLVGIAIIAGVVIISEGERPIPVSYAKRVRGMRVYGGVSTHLPLRVNQAGVIPIIFALSILLFPQMIINFTAQSQNAILRTVSTAILGFLSSSVFYGIAYFILVFLFTYFYTAVTFDPDQISSNLQKQGAFVPGIRPGRPTSDYLSKILTRITLVGALFLGAIAVLPIATQAATGVQALTIGGTGLLIVVSVVLETVKQVESQLVMREYE